MSLTQKQIESRLADDKRKIDYLLFLASGGTPGTGTVTNFVFTDANGVDGTVSTSTSTPTLSLAFTPNGILKSNGTTLSSAIAGDFPTLNQNTTGSAASLSTNLPVSRLDSGTDASATTFWNGGGTWESINLVVTPVGTGEAVLFDLGTDILYHKALLGTTFIDVSTVTNDVVISLSATGTPSSSTYLRGDNTWATIAGAGDVSKVGTPVNNQIGVWTGDGTIEGDTNFTWSGTQLVAKGSGSGVTTIDIFGGSINALQIGADVNAITRTNATNKFGGIVGPHYTNTEEPWSIMKWTSSVSNNTIYIGFGENPGTNSATSIEMYTASTTTTLSGAGVQRKVLLTNSKMHINDNTQNFDFQVSGDTDLNLFWIDASADNVVIGAATGTDKLNVTGNINLTTAGNKLKIATGSNASIGTATLVAGTVVVSTTAITTSSKVFVSLNTPGGTLGLSYSIPGASIVNGTSFVINAVDTTGAVLVTDTSTINWWIIN